MLSLVKVTLIGTLAEKPVIQDMEGGCKKAGLSVFTQRHWHDAEAREARQEKEWHRVVIVNQRLAAYAEAHLSQDDQVYLEGELRTNFWRSETYELQSMAQILLWQEGDRLRRITDEPDCHDPESALRMLAVAKDAQLVEAPSDDELLGYVA